MQYILTQDEMDNLISLEEYMKLQTVVDKKAGALDRLHDAIAEQPTEVKHAILAAASCRNAERFNEDSRPA